MRPIERETKGLKAFVGKGIKQLKPREVAEQKLKGSSRHFNNDQVVEYMELYDMAVNEMNGGVA